MAEHQIIEINGKRYDAQSGRLLPTPQPVARRKTGVIDGFSRSQTAHRPKSTTSSQASTDKPTSNKPKATVHHAATVNHLQHHGPQNF